MKFLSLFILSLSALVGTLHAKSGPVAAPEVRDQAAQVLVQEHANAAVIYAKGLVCSSCGIGLRIHLSKVDGVDRERFKKGVILDAANQLVVVGFKDEAALDLEAARQAIHDAGYEPAYYYMMEGDDLVKVEFTGADS